MNSLTLPARTKRRLQRWRASPPALLLYSFAGLITLGTLCLKSDWATQQPIGWIEALFTATSAVTITGLVVVDTATQFSLAGQLVILLLIQLGGIGFMTFTVLTALVFGFRIGLRHQLIAKEALNQTSLGSVAKAARAIALFAIGIELLGALLLATFWVPEKGLIEGAYHALFYSVSAFNNAGFALSSDSLSDYVGRAGIVWTISGLYIVGGLGYMVVIELWEKGRGGNISVYTRLVLQMTVLLNLLGTLAFFAFEYSNPATLGQLQSLGDKLLASWFQGTVPRSSGFNTVDISAITAATSTLFLLLMFIGGAPNSTAGGIRITTFAVLVAATRAFLRGRMVVTLYNRTISNEAVIKALAITVIGMLVIFICILALTLTERASFLDIAFEALSASATVGLSRGLTGELSDPGQLIIALAMLIGRIGPLSLGYILTVPSHSHVRYVRAEFPMG